MSKHAVVIIGRFQPPHAGHHMMVQKAIAYAKEHGADHVVIGSKSEGTEDNPLTMEKKRRHMEVVLGTPNIQIDPSLPTIPHQLQNLHDKGFTKITIFAGGKRKQEYEKFEKYFGQRTESAKTGQVLDLTNIKPENFKVLSSGERDEDADEGGETKKSDFDASGKMKIESISGTKLRDSADKGDLNTFKAMLPDHVTEMQATDMMRDVKSGLEQARANKKSSKKNIKEFVSPMTRMKLAKAARRTSNRRAILRKMRSKKRKNLTQLKKRAKNEVKDQFRRKVHKGSWKKLSYSQRASIDKSIARKKKMVDNTVKRIMPSVIRGETARLKKLNSSFDPVIDNFMSNFLQEEKTPERRPLDTQGKQRRRSQNRDNKRAQRQRDETAVKAGNITGKVMVVKDKTGNLEIIDKESYNPNMHQVVVSADKATTASVVKATTNPAFANTVTSERLFGYIDGAGDGKSEKAQKMEQPKSEEKKSSESDAQPQAPQMQMIPATKKYNPKKDTFPTSHGSQEMEAGIALSANSAYGMTPDQMKSKGLLDAADESAASTNPHQSFMPSCQRAAQVILNEFPGSMVRHVGRKKKATLTPEAKAAGVKDKTSKADLEITDPTGTVVLASLSVKIGGDTQLTSGSPAETTNFLKWSMLQCGDQMTSESKKEMDSLIEILTNELTSKPNPRTKQGETGLYLPGGAREKQDDEVNRREEIHRKVSEKISNIMNKDKKLATYFVYGCLSGHGKYKEGDSAIATHVFSANKDGTDAKISTIDMDYASRLIDKVKFQCTFKSSAVNSGGAKAQWEEFKERKKQLGEEVTPEEDFRAYSFRSVLRVFALTEGTSLLSGSSLVRQLLEKVSDKELAGSIPAEPQSQKEAIEYIKDAMKYIGNDSFKMHQFFEDSYDVSATQPVVDFTDIATANGITVNKIYVNGKEFNIPVEKPYNYTADGQAQLDLSEQSKQRNYRLEYDHYQGKPEQRANRSKRVLARRLMMKLGKVKKGDGKDVDHKDGNPQHNTLSNLRVRDRSSNRADHTD